MPASAHARATRVLNLDLFQVLMKPERMEAVVHHFLPCGQVGFDDFLNNPWSDGIGVDWKGLWW